MKAKLQQFLHNPLYVGIAAGVVGLLIGWMLIGWLVWPVEWYDATPSHLRADMKEDYARMAVDSFAKNQDAVLARKRFSNLGVDAQKVLDQISAKPGITNPMDIENYKKALAGQVVVAPTAAGVTPGAPTATAKPGTVVSTPKPTVPALALLTPTAAAQQSGTESNLWLLVLLCGALLVLGAALAYLLIFRKKGIKPLGRSGSQPMAAPAPSASGEVPIRQFMSTYKSNLDLFDDAYSIDSQSGEFLGECGVGISETIGVGEPKKVTAFELWLFDKNATVTKVLMSEHAFRDPLLSQKLITKGELVPVRSGEQVVIETATLQLVAKVIDMNYGQGALPPNSFFERLVLELAVYPKAKH